MFDEDDGYNDEISGTIEFEQCLEDDLESNLYGGAYAAYGSNFTAHCFDPPSYDNDEDQRQEEDDDWWRQQQKEDDDWWQREEDARQQQEEDERQQEEDDEQDYYLQKQREESEHSNFNQNHSSKTKRRYKEETGPAYSEDDLSDEWLEHLDDYDEPEPTRDDLLNEWTFRILNADELRKKRMCMWARHLGVLVNEGPSRYMPRKQLHRYMRWKKHLGLSKIST